MAMNLSRSMQDYLKAVLQLTTNGTVSTSDVAEHLNVRAASVTSMMKKLADRKLVERESYRGVQLTHAGRKIALEILRHHRLIETYLSEALGYSWDKVHDEAERLEHHISEEFEDRIASILGNPQYDPHGDPIPTKDGRMPPTPTDRLADAEPNDVVVVRRVLSRDSAVLRLLAKNGIGIGTQLRVVARNDDNRTLSVRHQKSVIQLAIGVCRHIFVER